MGILSRQQSDEMQRFFPEKCNFHWDGKGEAPMGSELVYAQARASAEALWQVCNGCSYKGECPVRQHRP